MSNTLTVHPPPMNGTFWTLSPAEIQQLVLSFLSVPQLILLGLTSQYHHDLVLKHIHARVFKLISLWSLPLSFFEFMHAEDVIISGSAILALLVPDCLTPNDLDAYVPQGALPKMHAFISDKTGYVLSKKPRLAFQDATDEYVSGATVDTGVKDVVFYRHPETNAVLNVIETNHSNPATAVFKFHSTFVMNYLTSNTLVCAYPKMTAEHVGLVNTSTSELSFRMVRCLLKYGVRGFNALERAFDWHHEIHDCESYPYCGRCRRKISDRFTLRVPFHPGLGGGGNVIDSELSWALACRYDCNPIKDVDELLGYVNGGLAIGS